MQGGLTNYRIRPLPCHELAIVAICKVNSLGTKVLRNQTYAPYLSMKRKNNKRPPPPQKKERKEGE